VSLAPPRPVAAGAPRIDGAARRRREYTPGMRIGPRRAPWCWTLALALAGCSVQPDGAELADNARFVEFGRARAIEVACGEGWARAAGERLAARLQAFGELPARAVEAGARRGRHVRGVLLVDPGHAAAEPVLAALDAELAAFVEARDPRGGALIATLPDPRRPQQALTVCVAWSGSELVDPGRDLDLERRLEPTWERGWQRFEGALCVAASDGSEPRAADAPPARTPQEWAAGDPALAWLPEADEQARAAVTAALGAPERPFAPVRVRLWESAWALGRVGGGTARTFVRPAAGLLELARDVDQATARGALAELHARAAFGEPRQRLLSDALAVHAAGAWWGRDLSRWCARLSAPALAMGLSELEREPELRPHRTLPLAALALAVRLELRGPADLRRAWSEGASLDAALAAAFEARLTELSARHGAELAREAQERRAAVRARPFRRGVNLVLERPAAGRDEARHGSPDARAALERARELGADAVALDWVAVLRPAARELAWGRADARWPWAGDLELAESARAARELGLDVLLKPHLWLSGSGNFAGWELVHSPEEWRSYFEAQHRLAVHAALLAELVDADVLCLAAEQRNPSATRDSANEFAWDSEHVAWKRARWHELIAAARAAFDGGLTYAAHWDGERHGVDFWDELDFLGLDLFAEFEPREGADGSFDVQAVRGQLWNELTAALGHALQVERPLLVTEFGYPSRTTDWTRSERPGGADDAQRQASVLHGLADALRQFRRGGTPLAGLFLWNLPVEGGGAYAVDGAEVEAAARRVLGVP
jgi:hypothetical protein